MAGVADLDMVGLAAVAARRNSGSEQMLSGEEKLEMRSRTPSLDVLLGLFHLVRVECYYL